MEIPSKQQFVKADKNPGKKLCPAEIANLFHITGSRELSLDNLEPNSDLVYLACLVYKSQCISTSTKIYDKLDKKFTTEKK